MITGLENLRYSWEIRLGCFYPKNLAPTGPNSRTRLASASPSMSGGGCGVRWGRTYLQVILVGLEAHLGGTITRTPE